MEFDIFVSEELVDFEEDLLQSEPKRMKRSTHEVIKYPCDKCENAASSAGSLKQHNKSISFIKCSVN